MGYAVANPPDMVLRLFLAKIRILLTLWPCFSTPSRQRHARGGAARQTTEGRR
jgi:hypothetical protein